MTKVLKKPDWTLEKLSELSHKQVQNLRANAVRHDDSQLVALCDGILGKKAEPKERAEPSKRRDATGDVTGFHFVCARDDGVTLNADGTFWTGVWVVDVRNAERAAEAKGYIALHTAKSEPSYRQGLIKAWRKVPRESVYAGREVKIQEGIEFLVEPSPSPLRWVGKGTGEKGYARQGMRSDK